MRFLFLLLLTAFFPPMLMAQCSFTVTGNNPISDYCFEASANLNYTLTGTPSGGIFSGDHVSGNTFSPPILSFIGEFNITYEVNNCSTTETITIGADFQLNGQSGSSFCISDAPFSLDPTIGGGTFSGEDIIGGGFNPSEAGFYDLTYTTAGGCSVMKTVEIGPSFTIEGINTDTGGFNTCEGNLPANLIGNPSGGTFSGPGFIGGQFNPAIVPGSFNITYTVSGCGSVTETIVVEGVGSIAEINESNLQSAYCVSDETVITPMGNLGTNATFFIGGVEISNFQPSNLGAGTHELFYSFEDENGCTSLDVYTFEVFALPNPDFDLPETYCVTGEAIALMPMETSFNSSIFTGTGIGTPSNPNFDPTISNLGIHTITHQIVDENGLCQAETSKNINVLPEVDASFDTSTSNDCFYGTSTLFYTGTNNLDEINLIWSVLDGEAEIAFPSPEIIDTAYISKDLTTDLNNFTIELQVSNGGCSASQQLSFQPNDLEVMILTSDQRINLGDPLPLEAIIKTSDEANLTFEWNNPESLSCTNCLTPIALPTETSTYTLEARNSENCSLTASIQVEVVRDILQSIAIPSAFSPNEDDVNDRFQVVASDAELVILKIYSRWGEKIFEGDGIKGWDGFHDLRLVENGVYLYITDVTFLSGETVQRHGYFTVLR